MGKKRKKNQKFINVLLIFGFMAGLALLLYPSIANYINERNSSKIIGHYSEELAKITEDQFMEMLAEAQDYNRRILSRTNVYKLGADEREEYNSLLNIDGDGMMGYIEIPKIGAQLPIYHGTNENTLQVAIGHLDWTSLPVGGKGTHCVLSGHRGLPNAVLFTNIDKLVEGDTFMLCILNQVYTYEVDQIRTVLPSNIADLMIEENEDYCTLMTCTPYGVNSHRLLVRGRRIDNPEEAAMVWISAEAIEIEPLIVSAVVAIPTLLLIVLIVFLLKAGQAKKRHFTVRTVRKKKM